MTKKRFVTTILLTCFTIASVFSSCTVQEGPHTHSFGEWVEVTAPTCTEKGKEKRTCECGEAETRDIDALGHDFGEFEKNENEHYKKCSRCDEEKDRGLHTFNSENTCTTCNYKQAFTENLAYSEIYAEDETTVIAYAVDGFTEETDRPEEIIIPSYHEGKPVTAISPAAFYAEAENPDSTIKKVTLPDCINDIGYNAFTHCTALEEINLENVQIIGQSAFWDTALTEVILKKATDIGAYAFYSCPALTKISLDCAFTVGEYAFSYNEALSEVNFGKNAKVTFGEDRYFYNDNSLKTITIDSNKVVFGISTLSGIEDGTTDVIFGDNVTAIPEKAMGNLQTTGNAIKSVTIGKNVKTIGDNAFFQCQRITEIVLPEGLTEIGNAAFGGCSRLEKATIPKSVTKIGENSMSSVKHVYYGGTAADWAKIDFANKTTSTPLYDEAVLYVNGEPCDTLDLRGVEKVNNYAFFGAKYTKIILGEELKELKINCFGHLSAQGSIINPFGSKKEASNKLEQLVILCKKLDLGNIAYFSHTFNADTKIFYYGTAEEMDENVTVSGKHRFTFNNNELTHYFYSETQPATEGNFWHYDDKGNFVIW